MEVENNDIFVGKEIIWRNLIVINKMTSKDKTFRKVEKLRIVFLIEYDLIKLLIIFKNAFIKCKQLLVIIVRVNDSLHEFIALCIKDDWRSKW